MAWKNVTLLKGICSLCKGELSERDCDWAKFRKYLCKLEGESNLKGWKDKGPEGRSNMLLFKIPTLCYFSLWPMSFNCPDPLEQSPARCNHWNCFHRCRAGWQLGGGGSSLAGGRTQEKKERKRNFFIITGWELGKIWRAFVFIVEYFCSP